MGLDLIELYRTKVKKQWKIAFFAVLVVGLLIHIYKFTNTLPNHDTVFNYYSDQNVIGSGRWLLSLACGISSYFDLPWVNGVISLVFIAMTAAVVVDVLEIENPFLICLCAGLLVAFPGITETFFFEFTADGYMLAMFLSALAVWFTRADALSGKRIFAAALCVCCACAIYQAYVSFALILALCYFILKLLDNAWSSRQIWRWIAAQILVYVAGLACYYVIWKLLMRIGGYTANNYQGISTLSLNWLTVLRGIPNSAKAIAALFFEWNPLEHGWSLYALLNLAFLVCAAIGVVYAVIKTKLYAKTMNFVLVLVSGVAIPFAACIWVFASEEVGYRPMMLQSVCLVYILVAVLYERYFTKVGKNLTALLLAVIIFNNGMMANISYYYMNRSYFSTYATATEMLARIHELDTDSNQIAVVGKTKEVTLDFAPHIEKLHLLGQLLEKNIVYDEIHLLLFMNETFYEDFEKADKGWQDDDETMDLVRQMSCWPEKGSIQLIGDIIFIKLGEVKENTQQ